MSALLHCICAPVGVYNYSDMQGDSPKSWGRWLEIKRKRVKRRDSGTGRHTGERFEGREYKR